MNKILIVNDKIKNKETNENISVSEEYKDKVFEINEITLKIIDNEDLIILLESSSLAKLKFNIILKDNIISNLFILVKGERYKINYNYDISKNSNLKIIKYNSINSINEYVNINLNGENSNIDYTLKSIGKQKESYDYRVFHNKKQTYSNIKNNGVNISGSMNIQISGNVYETSTECICNQNNRIINLTDNKCEIRPILYIDTDDVTANHSALIGSFEEDEIFYLNTMGISNTTAYNLLIKGFLLSDINNDLIKEEIIKDINKYWR